MVTESERLRREFLASFPPVKQGPVAPPPPVKTRGPLKVPRPSILDNLRLSDGQLAWPIAKRNGINEVAFRMRLKLGWSVDDAATLPVGSRSPRR